MLPFLESPYVFLQARATSTNIKQQLIQIPIDIAATADASITWVFLRLSLSQGS